jgi:hypothetical protein
LSPVAQQPAVGLMPRPGRQRLGTPSTSHEHRPHRRSAAARRHHLV